MVRGRRASKEAKEIVSKEAKENYENSKKLSNGVSRHKQSNNVDSHESEGTTPDADFIPSVLSIWDYVKFRDNGSLSRDRERRNSYYASQRLLGTPNHTATLSDSQQTASSTPGEVLNYYKHFGDYWNFFPKTDYTYSRASKLYKKEVAPGIPVRPNLTRRSLHENDDWHTDRGNTPLRNGQLQHAWQNQSWQNQSFSEKITTIVQTIVTVSVITTTTIVETTKRTVTHPKESPKRTFFLLFFLIPLIYYLYLLASDQTIYEDVDSDTYAKHSLGYRTLLLFTKPLMGVFSCFKYLFFLIINALSLLPVILWQVFSALISLSSSPFVNNNNLSSTNSATNVYHPIQLGSAIQTDPAIEIRKIVEAVLAEKYNTKKKSVDVNDIKEIVENALLEHEGKNTVARTTEFDSQVKEWASRVNKKVEILEKALEIQKEDIQAFQAKSQNLEEKLKLIQTTASLSTNSGSVQNNNGWVNGSTALAGPVMNEINDLIESKIALYHADRTGKADYALMSNGGTIVSIRCTQTYRKSAKLTIFGFPLWDIYNTPETIIKPGAMPGDCWAFEGSEGYVVVKLALPIHVTGVTLEHTPKVLTPLKNIESAPYQFSVWGLLELMDESPQLLGRFKYLNDKGSLQYFDIPETNIPYEMIELRIESNHGHMEYTCLYRFRVHGRPAS